MRPPDDMGPPKKVPRPGTPLPMTGDTTTSAPTLTKRISRHCDFSVWRRRQAAQRLEPLACGCRDPLFCECRPPLPDRPPPSERMVDGGRAAALHLLEVGFMPLLELDVLRALYRRGGADRRLAEELYELAGGDT